MKPGDIAAVSYPSIIFSELLGSHAKETALPEEILLILETYNNLREMKIFHPLYGEGYLSRSRLYLCCSMIDIYGRSNEAR